VLTLEKKLKVAVFSLLIITLSSMALFHLLEGWSWIDSLYMVVITLTTVGFREISPPGFATKLVIIGLSFSGIGIVAYISVQTANFLVEGHFNQYLRDKRMKNKLKKLYNHYIICVDSIIGKYVIMEFINSDQPFVVVTSDEKFKNELLLLSDNIDIYVGDPLLEETMEILNIHQARGVITVLNRDEDNLFLIISARGLNTQLTIISICHLESSEKKLRKVGANHIVSATMIGGLRLAAYALKPTVVSFLELMIKENNEILIMDEIVIPEKSFLVNKFIKDIKIIAIVDVMILGIKLKDRDKLIINPSPMTLLQVGDILITYGKDYHIENFRSLISQENAPDQSWIE